VFVCIGELKRETKHRCGTQKEQERRGYETEANEA